MLQKINTVRLELEANNKTNPSRGKYLAIQALKAAESFLNEPLEGGKYTDWSTGQVDKTALTILAKELVNMDRTTVLSLISTIEEDSELLDIDEDNIIIEDDEDEFEIS